MSPDEAAAALRGARVEGRMLAPFTDDEPALTATWGYDVQDRDRAHRVEAGEALVGAKLGLTSEAKQRRMGVDVPVAGFLTDAMLLTSAEVPAALDGWTQPRIEPEIAFRTCAPIDRALTRTEVTSYVDGVTVGAEILDSRFEDYRFRLADVLADNTSAAGVVLGQWSDPAALPDLAAISCTVTVDGSVAHAATGAAILGDPWLALVELSAHLAARGETLPAGAVVLAGALTDATPLEAGHTYGFDLGALGALAVAP